MILTTKSTVAAFRCPTCGKAVKAELNIFKLSGAMLRLKCPECDEAMTVTKRNDGNLRIVVPCLICAHPHHLTVSESAFFEGDLFTVPCSISGVDVLFAGKEEQVNEALEESEKRLKALLEEAGIDDFSAFRKEDPERSDPAVENVVHFLLTELEEEGKITCYCAEEGETPLYDFQLLSERVRIFCHCCNAEAILPLRSEADAEEFIKIDRIDLK